MHSNLIPGGEGLWGCGEKEGGRRRGWYIPGGSTVVTLRSIVISFTVSTEEKDFVFDVFGSALV